jgi:hypothetical protein
VELVDIAEMLKAANENDLCFLENLMGSVMPDQQTADLGGCR